MANSTTHLDLISPSQASKEASVNSLADAMSPNALFGRRAVSTAALSWGYFGGTFQKPDLTLTQIANGTIALTASATNYLYATSAGVVTKVTSPPAGWPSPLASDAIALYEIVTGASGVTSYIDYRAPLRGSTGATVPAGGTAGQRLVKNSGTDYDTAWASDPFDVPAFYPGVPSSSAKVLRVPVARPIAFPANFSGSYGTPGVAAAASAAFDVMKNDQSVGTITFPPPWSDEVSARAWTKGAAFSFSSSVKKFGNGAGVFDGSDNNGLTHATNTVFDFDTGDFCIKFWLYRTAATNTFGTVLSNGTATWTTGARGIMVYGSAVASPQTNKLAFAINTGSGSDLVRTTSTLSTLTWYYVELNRISGTTRLFLDGTLQASTSDSNSHNFSSTITHIGSNGWDAANSRLQAVIDDLLIEKGSGHSGHTADYTPPTAPHTVGAHTVSLLNFNGTSTFATSGGSAVSFAAGDILSVIAPASPDSLLADIGICLAGTR